MQPKMPYETKVHKRDNESLEIFWMRKIREEILEGLKVHIEDQMIDKPLSAYSEEVNDAYNRVIRIIDSLIQE